ncbi:unnamed protein product [Closterium sp. NIES-65]|nr:unnamed protein product [Closterium sp. NIES-65]
MAETGRMISPSCAYVKVGLWLSQAKVLDLEGPVDQLSIIHVAGTEGTKGTKGKARNQHGGPLHFTRVVVHLAPLSQVRQTAPGPGAVSSFLLSLLLSSPCSPPPTGIHVRHGGEHAEEGQRPHRRMAILLVISFSCPLPSSMLPLSPQQGSTCAMAESMLRASGHTTGLFTSPHLVDVRERFRLNGEMVSVDTFLLSLPVPGQDLANKTPPPAYITGLGSVSWPGRCEIFHDCPVATGQEDGGADGQLTFFLDSAHTVESMEVCGECFCDANQGGGADGGADEGADGGADEGADGGADKGADGGEDEGADGGADEGTYGRINGGRGGKERVKEWAQGAARVGLVADTAAATE